MKPRSINNSLLWIAAATVVAIAVFYLLDRQLPSPITNQHSVDETVRNNAQATLPSSQTDSDAKAAVDSQEAVKRFAPHSQADPATATGQATVNFLHLTTNFLSQANYSAWADRLNNVTNLPSDMPAFAVAVAPLIESLAKSGQVTNYAAALERSLMGTPDDADKLRMLVLLYGEMGIADAAKEQNFLAKYTSYVQDVDAEFRLVELTATSDADAAYDMVRQISRSAPEGIAPALLAGVRIFARTGDTLIALRLSEEVLSASGASGSDLLYVGNTFLQFGEIGKAIQAFDAGQQRTSTIYVREQCALGKYQAELTRGKNPQALEAISRLVQGGSTTVVRNQAKALLAKYGGSRDGNP